MRGVVVRLAAPAAVLLVATAAAANAQIAVSANDAKVKLVNGKVEVAKSPPADTVAFIDLRANPPKVLAELEVPASVVGPPMSVAVSPKEDLALVTAATRIDPEDATKTIPDDKLTVIDLKPLKPGFFKRLLSNEPPPAPKVLTTLKAGKGAATVSINKAGTLALVANRAEGTISVFTIAGADVVPAGKVTVGGEKSGPSGIAFTPDGKTALVTLDADNKILVLSVDGTRVEPTSRVIFAGLRPYGIDVTPKGEVAVVANIGMGGGDTDTISVIDLKAEPARVVNTYTVGQTPEGIKISPDGKYVAVIANNGSNLTPESPFFNRNGLLQVWTRNANQLAKTAELPIGRWCQGIAWSSNGRTVLAQCMVEEEIVVARFTGRALEKVGSIKTKGGPAGIRTAEP
ncbi:MAG: YncE family protein [Hyphomicrobiaceae bacterium]|nr:YncE family protein [Hyphomicrobiaceae bacterium]